MCCFSRPVTSVNATKIFARLTGKFEQGIVYQMNLDAPEDLAMILPIPVAQPAKDDAITFLNLEGYKDFFKDLEKGFPKPKTFGRGWGTDEKTTPKAQLKVHSVGAFDASFVPNTKSFHRLDERFRLPDGTWDKLPQYASYGFAVFKLKKGNSKVHPMAFKFPTALLGRLYFPTVHIHDGQVHDKEDFDHVLYGQAWKNAILSKWQESTNAAGRFMHSGDTKGLVWEHGHIYRTTIKGKRDNKDIIVLPKILGG
jgi:hypothetical protein